MATQDGLNKFDGTGFYVYRDEPFDTNSISSNYINDLLCDSKGRIWVGTANHGLNVLLPGRESFLRFSDDGETGSLESNLITEIYEDPAGNIWIGTGSGLYRVKVENSRLKDNYRFEKINLLAAHGDTSYAQHVNVIMADRNKQLWVGTYAGLYKINNLNGYISGNEISYFNTQNSTLANQAVLAMTTDKYGRIWIGGRNGIDVMNSTGEKLFNMSVGSPNASGMKSDHITSLLQASDGKIWIGYFDHGLQVAQTDGSDKSRFIYNLPYSGLEYGVLEKGYVLSLCEDKITPGIVWAGFNAGGVIRMVPVIKKFHTNHLFNAPVKTSFVVNLLKDSDSTVWIGTSHGLLYHDRKKNTYRLFKPSEISGNPKMEDYITGLVSVGRNEIYFGSGIYLYVLSKSGDKFKVNQYKVPGNHDGMNNRLRALVTDKYNNIYLVQRFGIYRFIPSSASFMPVISVSDQQLLGDRGFFIGSYFVDNQGNHWRGSTGGLDVYPAVSGQEFPDFSKSVSYRHNPKDTSSLRNQHILCFAQDRNNNVWLGTMNGLTRVVENNGKRSFINYSTRDGLNNNVVYAILPDHKTGHLWLSTNNGLTEFNADGYAVATYDIRDGLQSNEFNSYASFLSGDGEMFFGGIDGYTSFYPEQIVRDTTLPLINISNMVLNGNKIVNLSGLESAREIDLKYRDNSFTINFAGLHYADPHKNRYAYMLEGFQTDWTDAGTSRSVNFSQLPPGRYTFRVKAANSDNMFNEAGAMFVINIKPPFYKTIWFYLLLAFTIAGIIYGLFKYRLSMKMEQVKEVEKIRKATAADFHDELGHKLTVISWFAEILKKKIGPDQSELRPHLDKIIEASGNLYHTMKDMLWAMDPEKDSVYDLYNQIREFGRELFDSTGIEFEAGDVPGQLKDNIISPSSKRHILLIFKEVMHNSLKHAHGTATSLDLVSNGDIVKFRFRDNGVGFKLNGQGVGRGLENVKRRANYINAAIRIHSEEQGTVAELDVPVDHKGRIMAS